MRLKILTLNLHCLEENNIELNQKTIIDEILKRDVDIIFLQEVAQIRIENIYNTIHNDNYALKIQKGLKNEGVNYYLYFEPIKESFGKYDEGLAIISKYPLNEVNSKLISKTADYSNWKTRKILTGKMTFSDNLHITIGTSHFGWSDGYEVFEDQFDLANDELIDSSIALIAGDFNILNTSEEYKYICNKGWIDIFKETTYFAKPTFRGDSQNNNVERIDYVFINNSFKLIDNEILFIDTRVSDHYGVYAEIDLFMGEY
jgi:maltose 6'-phosphate phosphatase